MIDAYLDRSLIEVLEQRAEAELRTPLPALPPKKAAVLASCSNAWKSTWTLSLAASDGPRFAIGVIGRRNVEVDGDQ